LEGVLNILNLEFVAGGGGLAFPSCPSCLGGEKRDYHKGAKSTKVMVLFGLVRTAKD
jgi:hypothetical protein